MKLNYYIIKSKKQWLSCLLNFNMYYLYKRFDINKNGAKWNSSKFYVLFVKKICYRQLAPS